jgi:hypothetical protein
MASTRRVDQARLICKLATDNALNMRILGQKLKVCRFKVCEGRN